MFTSGCAFVCITCKGRGGSLSVTEINPQTPSKHKVWVRGRSWGVERWFRVCFERPIDVRRKRALIVFVCGYTLCYLSMHHTRLSLGLLRSDFLLCSESRDGTDCAQAVFVGEGSQFGSRDETFVSSLPPLPPQSCCVVRLVPGLLRSDFLI